MKRTWCLGMGLLALVAFSASAADKGTEVKLDGVKSTAPASWKEEAPANQMRLMQFKLPHAKDDKADGEVVIFRNAGGTPKANVERWKSQFRAPEGKKIDDVTKVSEIKIGGRPATMVEIQGTYLFKARPFDPQAKTEARPDYTMIAIHFEGDKNLYHIRMVGPSKTIDQYKKGFEEWLKEFK